MTMPAGVRHLRNCTWLGVHAGSIDAGDADPAWCHANLDWLMAGRGGAILGRGFTKFALVPVLDNFGYPNSIF
ncbi:hypothetical protein CEJ45_19245 [Herbaspirillum aquaticum]|jgi:hypothetical protein|uniref:Uncharacterized protein n=1 Tax=Herbaspirillum aquaticum TaxID=568783 RepID=A0A225SPD5_9BURK|nr:hypothetical protein CEJ45_19245 [Herbaspirillum aquaticum]